MNKDFSSSGDCAPLGDCLGVVLAAGEGTRMLSSTPKVLHKIAGLEMVCHVLQNLHQAGCNKMALVVGKNGQKIAQQALKFDPQLAIHHQDKPLGTAHAALAAHPALTSAGDSDVLIVFGDTPLLQPQALLKMRHCLAQGADVAVSGFYTDKPTGYGRLVQKQGQLLAIIEEKDANLAQKEINFCNGGVMALRGRYALALLEKVGNDNAAGEFYLPDIVAIAKVQGLDVRSVELAFEEVMGVNTRAELAQAEALWQERKRRAVMAGGVSLLAPQTVYFAYDSQIEPDVVIEPHVVFGSGVKIGRGTLIRAFCHLEGAIIGENGEIGPFARLRPGTNLQQGVKIGNFCEIKQTHVGKAAKINHLSYIGDATIGDAVNIGAGTITCNYDGVNKWQTVIGNGAFIGSNSALVAPVTIGEEAYIASGSVITQSVEAQALAFGRARQVNKLERAAKLRQTITNLQKQQQS